MKVPCTRYDAPGDDDARLLSALALASRDGAHDLSTELLSLYDYKGVLLATWKDEQVRGAYQEELSRAWETVGGSGRTMHLLSVDEQYDYQEDVLDNVAEAE
jgi:hypothetical protein